MRMVMAVKKIKFDVILRIREGELTGIAVGLWALEGEIDPKRAMIKVNNSIVRL